MIAGFVDRYGWLIEGWAACPEAGESCTVSVMCDGIVLRAARAELPRIDVFESMRLLNVGFSIDLSGMEGLDGKKLAIVAKAADSTRQLGDFVFVQRNKVEVGSDDYLFLVNDSNDCDGMLSGKHVFSDEQCFNAAAAIRGRELLLQSLGIKLVQVVAPEKSDLLNKLRKTNLNLSNSRFAHEVTECVQKLGGDNFFFLRDFLDQRLDAREAFTKTDNHLSDYAIDLAVQHVLSDDLRGTDRTFREYLAQEFRGDLSIALGDPQRTEVTRLRINHKDVDIDDRTHDIIQNGASLTGSVITFTNRNPVINGSVFVVGTSTARAFLYSLAGVFQSGRMVWGVNFNYKNLIEFAPSLVFFAVPERLLHSSVIR